MNSVTHIPHAGYAAPRIPRINWQFGTNRIKVDLYSLNTTPNYIWATYAGLLGVSIRPIKSVNDSVTVHGHVGVLLPADVIAHLATKECSTATW